MTEMKDLAKKIKSYRNKIIEVIPSLAVVVTLLFVGCSSYAFGMLSGAEIKRDPLVIERYPHMDTQDLAVICDNSNLDKIIDNPTTKPESVSCVFVGSVNGTKYYPPGCSLVERIKIENLRCFASEEGAIGEGYERTSACQS